MPDSGHRLLDIAHGSFVVFAIFIHDNDSILTLRAVMQFARFPEEVIDQVDAQLRKIPNP